MFNLSVILSDISSPYVRDLRDRSKDTSFLLECLLDHLLYANNLMHVRPRVYVRGKILTEIDVTKAIIEQELFGSIYDIDMQVRNLKQALSYKLSIGIFRLLQREDTVLTIDHIYVNTSTILFTINVIQKGSTCAL